MPGKESSEFRLITGHTGLVPAGAQRVRTHVMADAVGMSRCDLMHDPDEIDPQLHGLWGIERGWVADETMHYLFIPESPKGWHQRAIMGPYSDRDKILGGALLKQGHFLWSYAFSWDPVRSGWMALLATQDALRPEKMSLAPHYLLPTMFLARMGEHRVGRTNPVPSRWLRLLGSMEEAILPMMIELLHLWLEGRSEAAEQYMVITGSDLSLFEHQPGWQADVEMLKQLIEPELFAAIVEGERWEPAVIRALDAASTTLWTRSPTEAPAGGIIRGLLPIARWRRNPVRPSMDEVDIPTSLNALELAWLEWRSHSVGSRSLNLQLPTVGLDNEQAAITSTEHRLPEQPEVVSLSKDELTVLRELVKRFKVDEPFPVAPFIASLRLGQTQAIEALAHLGEYLFVRPSSSEPGCFEVTDHAAGALELAGKPSRYAIVSAEQWQKPNYLWRKYLYDWGPLLDRAEQYGDEEARTTFLGEIDQLAAMLLRHHEDWRLHQYLNYILGVISGFDTSRGGDALSSVYHVYALLYWSVCQAKGGVLIGIDAPQVELQQREDYEAIGRSRLLWGAIPASLAEDRQVLQRSYADIVSLSLIAYSVMPFLSGMPPVDSWHRLMVPEVDAWSLASQWMLGQVERFLASVSRSVGQPDIVSRDSWTKLMQAIQLERRYVLVPNRPVLIRLPKHPVIRDVLLLQVGDVLVARLSTTEHKDLLHVMPLVPLGSSDIIAGGTIPTIQALIRGESSENYALNYFLGKLYQALVTLETLEGTFSLRKQRTDSSPGSGTPKPGDMSVWQIIPRRVYREASTTDNETDTLVEREALSAEDLVRQERQRHFFGVVGHPRTLTGGRKPSLDRLNKARELGVFLLKGQTFVKPYHKGTPLTDEVSTDDISRFLMRRGVLEADSGGEEKQ